MLRILSGLKGFELGILRATMRAVKLGRSPMDGFPLTYHWAVKVGNTWYEIHGFAASSAGDELVGETGATDTQINVWVGEWRSRNSGNSVSLDNCQTFAYALIAWLTNGNFSIPHRFNVAYGDMPARRGFQRFARVEDGNLIARYTTCEYRKSAGALSMSLRSIHAQTQAVAGPEGVGAWTDISGGKLEAAYGNWIGGHIEPNLNTGAGVRNGNLDVHLLGFGAKVGFDGIEVDSPLGGVNACSMM
jgi:hypothetical protein